MLLTVKNGKATVKVSDSQKASSAIASIVKASQTNGLANIESTYANAADAIGFVVNGGPMPAGWPNGLNIADASHRYAFVVTTKTENAAAAAAAYRTRE